jgi:hypothetical protein
MKLFDYLKFGRLQKPRSPIKTVQPPAEARALRRKALDKQDKPPEIAQRKEPTLGSLVDHHESFGVTDDEAVVDDNPYDTQAWQLHPTGGLHRADILKDVDRDREDGDHENPYDKSVGRRGW